MQRLARSGRLLAALFWLMASSIAGSAHAHDVQNSEIRVVFGESDREGSIEVWQTMSLETAYATARTSAVQSKAKTELGDSDVLAVIGSQMLIEASAAPCALEKQAHRRVHHDTRLQMRFLFTCAEGERPVKMILAWMPHAPGGHFAVLEQNTGQGSPFKVIEGSNPVVEFDRP